MPSLGVARCAFEFGWTAGLSVYELRPSASLTSTEKGICKQNTVESVESMELWQLLLWTGAQASLQQ
ncbi:hypothetical protein N7541_009097 [Penicillium brevicompactum]|uniref:Uncharacterized protein n=1 Tax=Penicillium brevicompactum TaxID=5074 RepID=A0A9W9UNL9_PENBR|nr:hypothetical protein N7541_009097 [Penicillium brevicompactum]